ncbi:Mitochondrial distribution and morphology protein 12 [Coemansia erecta]|uniref:1-phosphatidylinositol-3-phosphate 5-kinase n=1 Tax=Coemansia erecta TaxID=147472 RepID=A0A9W8CRJ6_9FUNG|nr:Mitochondrial distribution and morphology protein 12 [Coemansia erecta]
MLPSSKTRFLQALYRRATLGRYTSQDPPPVPPRPTPAQQQRHLETQQQTRSYASSLAATSGGSSGDQHARRRVLGSRAQPQATVAVARPAPEVEFSRVSDMGQAPADGSASLMSLRASQQGAGFAPHIGGPGLALALDADAQMLSAVPGSGSGMYGSHLDSLPRGLRRESSVSVGGKDEGGSGTAVAGGGHPAAWFGDESGVPFRANAVEIAAQDDRNECAFLSHDSGGDAERSRAILTQLVGQLQPTRTLGSHAVPRASGREAQAYRDPAGATSRVRAELAGIAAFNREAQQRACAASGSGLTEFAQRHLLHIVRQLLGEIGVEPAAGWDAVVFGLALNAVERVRPDVRGGDNMDLRRYVRIKRIPGGRPCDSQYVSGIVFTRNVAHRRMARYLEQPRVMLLTLALDVSQAARHSVFGDELRLQQAFADKLVQRVADAAPGLVLAEKTVPRGVLEGLMRHGICVVHGVKRSVIRAAARCTGADIVASLDRFSAYPRTGTCAAMAVQTFEHPSLAGLRKSFVFLDGCDERLGGTIVLRGDDFGRLGDIKQVVDLVVGLAYSMQLEGALLVDEFALAAAGEYGAAEATEHGADPEDSSLALQALAEYRIVLSSSPCVRIPPPHVLVSMRKHELDVRALAGRLSVLVGGRHAATAGGEARGAAASGVALLLSRHQQQGAASASRMRQQYESELALHESYIHAGRQFLEANPQAVSLWDYQSIVVAYTVTCRKHDHMVCVGPQYHPIAFYSHLDVTLGQYLEEMCFDLDYDCPGASRRCAHAMYEHRRSYIHNHGRIDVTMDEHPCPLARMSDVILMWSECRRCRRSTPVARMSDAAWRYSFGKYLETTFYNAPLRVRGAGAMCAHDVHRDHVRCFGLRNMAVRIRYSEFDTWSIATPSTPLYFDIEVSMRLKAREADELRARLDAYYASLAAQLAAFPFDRVYADKADECLVTLRALEARAATELVYFRQTLEQTVRNTHPADTLVVVFVYEALQEKVVRWNLQFSELAQTFIQLDSGRRSAMSQVARAAAAVAMQRRAGMPMQSAADGGAPGLQHVHLKDLAEIDGLSIIDGELHAGDASRDASGAVAHAGFARPQLGGSPTESEAPDDESLESGMSRLHRRLSLEAMRRDRVRQERLAERRRRVVEMLEARAKKSQTQQQQQQQQTQEQTQKEPLAQKLQQLQPHTQTKATRSSTRRLIGGVVADVDADEPETDVAPRQTEFPALRGPMRARASSRYAGAYSAKVAQPLFDMLHRALPHGNQQQQQQQSADMPSRIPQPLSSFGRPASARSSGIPRPPNIRGRTPSPAPGHPPPSTQPQTGADNNGGSNVFVRLAKRLNSARGTGAVSPPPSNSQTQTQSQKQQQQKQQQQKQQQQQQHHQQQPQNQQAVLGTMPRKMNMLLPAAAQYMSQHPRRPAMSQVQVFHTKPSSDDSTGRRSAAPARRHSYQPSGDQQQQQQQAEDEEDDDDYVDARRSTLASTGSGERIVPVGGSAAAEAEVDTVTAGHAMSHSQRSHRSLRLRAATTSQMPQQPPAAHERRTSAASRASNIIPTITRRLGLGFGFRSAASRNASGSSRASTSATAPAPAAAAAAAAASDPGHEDGSDASAPLPPLDTRHLRRGARRPIPPQLASSGEAPTGIAAPSSSSSASSSSDGDTESLSSDTSSDGLSGVDDHLPLYRYTRSAAHTPVGSVPHSARNTAAYHLDSPSASAAQMDLYLSSPMRQTTPYASLAGSNRHSQRPRFHLPQATTQQQQRRQQQQTQGGGSWNTDSEDGSSGITRTLMGSTRRPRLNLRLRADSSSDGDASDSHEPGLHFGSAAAGSDADEHGVIQNADEDASDREAKSAAAYLQSVIDSGVSEPDHAPLAKVSSFESAIDTAAGASTAGATTATGGASAPGEPVAALPLPQENFSVLWKTLSSLLPATGAPQLFQMNLDLAYPLDATEHVIAGSPIIVRETEPSSIIAFTLLDSMYRNALHAMFERAREEVEAERSAREDAEANAPETAVGATEEKRALGVAIPSSAATPSGALASSPVSPHTQRQTPGEGYRSHSRSSSNLRSRSNSMRSLSGLRDASQPMNEFVQPPAPTLVSQDAVIERIMLHSPDHHLKFEFTAGQTPFVCKVYYAAQFEALRRCNNCEDSYIESLSRCMPYIAKGGKSGSAFLRTRDQRFIVKQVSKPESDAFLKFAPFYFEHMHRTYRDVMLTVLAKIFGFCRVSYRKQSGKWVKMSVVIMENLFYERSCARVFDLKGSVRNRMVEETGEPQDVLQDENLVRLIRQNPICIRQQTKRHLHDAIWNDTLFLSKMNVMDYSLLVGFDEQRKELVVGIVDFIRTFTWDKKLESWIKEAGILGGGDKGPTIVSPKQYKNRFREAMERYFLMVPDKFFVMQDDDDIN